MAKIEQTEIITLPTLPLRGTMAFPNMSLHFDVSRESSIKAVEYALEHDRTVFLVAQKDIFEEHVGAPDTLYNIGVAGEIRQCVKAQDDVLHILVDGLYRARIRRIMEAKGCLFTEVEKLPLYVMDDSEKLKIEAVTRSVKDSFERYANVMPQIPRETVLQILFTDDPQEVFEMIVFNIYFDFDERHALLQEDRLFARLVLLNDMLLKESMIIETQKQLKKRTQENIDRGQREYFLREQQHIIGEILQEEYGDGEADEQMQYRKRIMALDLPEEVSEKLLKEAARLGQMPPASQEAYVITSYLDTVLDLPWDTLSEDELDLREAKEQLDEDHYGLEKVKERILESLAVRVLNPQLKGQILCLVGPPGIGKSSIARSIAASIGRQFARVSLGGVRDEADIRGHRRTYVGAMPGRIIAALQQAGTRNPLILLDELDKMSNEYKGDPSAALLEVLDSEQNDSFRDHYIELPFDLSQVLFVATANTLDSIPAPLRDRMEIIELNSYTREEKFQIARRHLVRKQVEAHGMRPTQCQIEDAVLYEMIDAYTREAGVRSLERTIAAVCRKVAKTIASGERKRITVRMKDVKDYLGIPKYLPDAQSTENTVGMVNGLAWTAVGGVLMPLEALVLDGTGKIEITGSLGNVMQESAKLAVSYARSVAKDYGIAPDFYTKKDIHIHAPEGAVPKDGPSAGVTMATALISALSGIPARADVAMTGEITLHGRVMPIGGLREKSMAAYKAGIRTVLIPEGNQADLEEVDTTVREQLNFIPVRHLSQVLDTALDGGTVRRGRKPAAKPKASAAVSCKEQS